MGNLHDYVAQHESIQFHFHNCLSTSGSWGGRGISLLKFKTSITSVESDKTEQEGRTPNKGHKQILTLVCN